MKYPAFYFAAGLFILLGAGCAGVDQAQSPTSGELVGNQPADATSLPQPQAPMEGLKDGQIKVFQKSGDVQLLSADGTRRTLNKGDVFGDGTIVLAGSDGHALIGFSNGAVMKLDPNCQLEIKNFKQAPFDEKAAGGTFLALAQDPSCSITELNLINGTLQGEIRHLDESAGSKFTVDTPAGSVGIRGTVISISVARDDTTGQVTAITASCLVGVMTFTPYGGKALNAPASANPVDPDSPVSAADSAGISIPAGAQIQVTLAVNPATGIISGVNISGASLHVNTSEAALNALFQTINAARGDPSINLVPLAPVPVPSAAPPAITSRVGAPPDQDYVPSPLISPPPTLPNLYP